jgi:CRP/FNR family transcriptional regulator, nitrogen fixation regulation protein
MATQFVYRLNREPAAAIAQAKFAEPREHVLGLAGSVQNFAQDREIYAEGAPAETFYKVVSGVVRTCKFLSDGRRQIDAFYQASDIFGIEGEAQHSLSAEAVSDCTVISYRRRGADVAAAGGQVADQLFEHLMQRLARAQGHALLLGRRSAIEKVAAFLVDWADCSLDHRSVALAMTRQDIADYLGLTIETVSRTLSHLERNGLIEMPSARQIHLTDLEALRDLNV